MVKNINKQSKKKNREFGKTKTVHWDRLDNTANLFPVIASESMTNVYRISVTLFEEIEPELLQKSVEKVLPYFDMFQYRLKRGMFWYYFETNRRPYPKIVEESTYPCQFINPYMNNEYLFRITFYHNRINLEVFHALTDGNGALNFLREITYQYLRYKHPELKGKVSDRLHEDTSLDIEDSYIKNYKHSAKKTYKTERAVVIRGERFGTGSFGLIHGYIDLKDIKRVAKEYGVTLNQYLIGVYTWAIYKRYLNGMVSKKAISTCVPVNLRPYFDSNTTKNFFVVVSAVFKPVKEEHSFEEVLAEITESLRKQVTKENLERLFSYNVSNEKNMILRAVPLFVKNIAMKMVYKKSAHANTSTVTNLGVIQIADAYENYIDKFHAFLSMSEGQNMKGAVCSYRDTMVFTFSSAIRDTSIQKAFFRKLTEDGIHVSIETNGVYYE